jgi:recombination protein RecA
MNDNKKQALTTALLQIEKQFGKGTVMRMGDVGIFRDIQVIPTGSLTLDIALGCGGLPKGRIVEIYGPESSGKTTMTLEMIAQAQKIGGTAAFIDAEHALDPSYAEKIGVNMAELLVSQPDNGEQALEIVDVLVRSGGLDILVVDSVAALTPRAELEGDMGATHVGLQARLMLRQKIGVTFGSPETTTGGNALKFYSSVRLDIRRIGALKRDDEIIGNETRIKVVKNKVAPPFKEAEFEILYGEGVSFLGELIDLGVKYGLLQKSGSWYSYQDEKIAQGKENTRQFLQQNPDKAQQLEIAIRNQVFNH